MIKIPLRSPHKAFERFVEAAQRQALRRKAAHSLQSSAKDVSARKISFTDANVHPAFDLAQKLVRAKDPQELLAHQSEYVKMQLAALEKQAKELGAAALTAVPPKKQSRHFILKAPVWESVCR